MRRHGAVQLTLKSLEKPLKSYSRKAAHQPANDSMGQKAKGGRRGGEEKEERQRRERRQKGKGSEKASRRDQAIG